MESRDKFYLSPYIYEIFIYFFINTPSVLKIPKNKCISHFKKSNKLNLTKSINNTKIYNIK